MHSPSRSLERLGLLLPKKPSLYLLSSTCPASGATYDFASEYSTTSCLSGRTKKPTPSATTTAEDAPQPSHPRMPQCSESFVEAMNRKLKITHPPPKIRMAVPHVSAQL